MAPSEGHAHRALRGEINIPDSRLVDVHDELGKAKVIQAVSDYLGEIGVRDQMEKHFGLSFGLSVGNGRIDKE